MTTLATYSFKDVKAAITGPGGSFALGDGSGNAEEGITTSMVEEKTSTSTGSDGAVMHSLHAGETGTMTVRLLKTSPVNALLNQLYNSQKQFSGLWGQNAIILMNVAIGDVITGTQMAFVKHPDLVYAKDGNFNEWEFRGVVEKILGTGTPVAA